MPQSDQPEYLLPYREAIDSFGPGFDATLWSSREGQVRRFDVLIDLGSIGEHTVLDVGCGTGDFAQRLKDRSVPFREYIGVDAMPEMIELAQAQEDHRCRFKTIDIVAQPEYLEESAPDLVVLSGTLNAMDESVARALLEQAWSAARVGLVFNFLSNRAHPEWDERDLSPARRYDTLAWLDWAMSRTPLVRFTQAYYRGHDATIAMYKAD